MNSTTREPTRRTLLALTAAATWAAAVTSVAQTEPKEAGDYAPTLGQSGKDVMWLPTSDQLVDRLLQLAAVTARDNVIDLGSGDGKIVIAAARDFKARALGIEYNPALVELSKRNAQRAGVAERAEFVRGDIFATNFAHATVVTMYLLPEINLQLRHTLMAMKPGTRVVSHDFDMAEWEPDERSRAGGHAVHLWVIPANAGGEWRLRFALGGGQTEVVLAIEQTFQKIRGEAKFGGFETSLREPRVLGDQIGFAFTDSEGVLRDFRGVVSGARISGTVSALTGAPSTFTAERQGNPPPIAGSGPVDQAQIDRARL